ncbi:hypothetical protein ACFQ1S_33540 [Kibdelosporangium lantanae]|uniref:Secreted protein n=1 Tax=Kibdelosporangium lantanae TaxID=1497396 RepID=A0ABW3MIZ4_9PSEU
MRSTKKRTYTVAGALALAAVLCEVAALAADLTVVQFVAIGLVCAAVATLATGFSRGR